METEDDQDMEKQELKIGLGKLLVYGSLEKIRGKFITVSVVSSKGPCNDESCQVIRKVTAEIGETDHTDGYVRIDGNGFSIFMQEEIFNSINRGRLYVRAKVSRSGSVGLNGMAVLT
jgi:hypothetical protein